MRRRQTDAPLPQENRAHMLSAFRLAEDEMWIVALAPETVSIYGAMTELFDAPEAFVNQYRLPGTPPIVFAFGEPTDLQFTYDLPEKYPWIVQGVYRTNRISIHVPTTAMAAFSPFARTASGRERAAEFLRMEKEKIDIRLILDYGLAYAHFDPTNEANEDNRFPENFARIVTHPSQLAEYLTSKQDEFNASFRSLNGDNEEPVNLPIRFAIGDRLTIQASLYSAGAPAALAAETGQYCVKTYGHYEIVQDASGRYVQVLITEVWRVPYSP
ncbi:MAG: hypothetical protein SFU56_15710 [Capsulimonadales bacterium]|nr:hypothetical protein [Capsulimonadales bacterium]